MNRFLDVGELLSVNGCTHNFAAQPCPHLVGCFKCVLEAKRKLNLSMIEEQAVSRVRTIPSNVLEQFDILLRQANQAMCEGKEPPILQPMIWDALLVLRQTGIRFNELVHLEAASQLGDHGCLEQNAEGWWLRISNIKLRRKRSIPIQEWSGAIEAIHRQSQRIMSLPTTPNQSILFRDSNGQLTSAMLRNALRKLAPYLVYEGQPYTIYTHQFRNTIAQEVFEYGCLDGLTAMLGYTGPAIVHDLLTFRILKDNIRYLEHLDRFQQNENLHDENSLNRDKEQQDENQQITDK